MTCRSVLWDMAGDTKAVLLAAVAVAVVVGASQVFRLVPSHMMIDAGAYGESFRLVDYFIGALKAFRRASRY